MIGKLMYERYFFTSSSGSCEFLIRAQITASFAMLSEGGRWAMNAVARSILSYKRSLQTILS